MANRNLPLNDDFVISEEQLHRPLYRIIDLRNGYEGQPVFDDYILQREDDSIDSE